MLGTWIIEVPSPWESSPPRPLSLKLATANPIIWQQQPVVDAPAARPDRPSEMARAALLMGSVRTRPIITETAMPIGIGCRVVAALTMLPSQYSPLEISGPAKTPARPPATMVPAGTRTMSTPVLPDKSRENSAPARDATSAPTGSPTATAATPPSNEKVPAPIAPVIMDEKSPRGDAPTE